MSKPLLSILVPTVMERDIQISNLFYLEELKKVPKHKGKTTIATRTGLEVIIIADNKEMTIGEKRELLYKEATGLFSWQIDDDDDIAPNAIELILEAIKSNPEVDCITFREKCTMNGVYKSSNHSLRYSQWMDNSDGYDYVRSPFYKDVIRTDIAKSVPFPHIRYNEDEQWSVALLPHLHSEIHIDEELYYYIYEPKESHNERYGIV